MEYHDHPLQFINKYYFHSRTEGDDHYRTLNKILGLLFAVNYVLLLAMITLSHAYIYAKLTTIIKRLTSFKIKETEKLLSKLETENSEVEGLVMIKLTSQEKKEHNYKNKHVVYFVQLPTNNKDAKSLSEMIYLGALHIKEFSDTQATIAKYYIELPNKPWHRKIQIMSLLIVSALINKLLFAFNVISVIRIYQYDNEVLSEDENSGEISIIVLLISWLTIIAFALLKVLYDYKIGNGVNIISITVTSISMNLWHILSYHMPYMTLAFIYNPVQSITIYFGLLIYVICGYFLFWSFESSCDTFLDDNNDCISKLFALNYSKKIHDIFNVNEHALWLSCFKVSAVFVVLVAIVYCSITSVYVISFGSFDDFQGAQNLILPLIIGAFGYFILKPTYKEIKQHEDEFKKATYSNQV